MYYIKKIHIHEGWSETWREEISPSIAYQLAIELHAATMGLSNNPALNKEHKGPFVVHILDEFGNSAWQKCSESRCPDFKGLFH